MSLTADAYNLLEVLNQILACLDKYALEKRNAYVQSLADAIRGAVKDYEQSITIEKSRPLAQEALSALAEPMWEINAAATKGEMPIFPENDDSLDRYWRLYAIFRESGYSHETLE